MTTRRMVRMKSREKVSIARYVSFSSARRQRSEELIYRNFMVSGGSILFKTKCKKAFKNKNNIAFELRYTATTTTCCYKCAFSSDDAGDDGPSCPFLGIHEDWTLGYESPLPFQTSHFYIYKG